MSDAQQSEEAFRNLKRQGIIDERHWNPETSDHQGPRHCLNCGHHLTPQYVRGAWPDGVRNPPACPHCTDLIVLEGEVRERRSHTNRGGS